MSFNGWEEVKLKDLISSVSETYKQKSEKVVLINTSDVLEGTVLNHSYVDNKNLKGQFKKTFQRDDILYSEIRPKNKRFAYVDFDPNDYIASTKLMVLRRKTDRIDSKYLFQLMKNDSFINTLQSLAETRSGTFPQITFTELGMQSIMLPSLKEQESIAYILSTLDDKIEVNNRINETLENMAQEIFKRWFVDFEFPNEDGEPYKSSGGEMVESELGIIPKGWKIGILSDVANFYNGYPFKSKELCDEDSGEDSYHVFKMGHIKKGGGLNKDGTKSYVRKSDCLKLSRFVLKKGDLLMCMTDMKSNVALLGHTALMDENDKYILNQRVGLLRVKSNEILGYPYLYILTNSNDFLENLRSRANSGVQVNLSSKEIQESKIVIPSQNIHINFNKTTSVFYKRSFDIAKENIILKTIRNLLLPKLMSGEIRVPMKES